MSKFICRLLLSLFSIFIGCYSFAQSTARHVGQHLLQTTSAWDQHREQPYHSNYELMFEPNRGQGEVGFDFLARSQGLTTLISPTVFSVVSLAPLSNETNNHAAKFGVTALRVKLSGARESAKPETSMPLRCVINDFSGADPTIWHLKIPTYGQIQYSDIYDGIDITYHGKFKQLEYDFHVHAGADPNLIHLVFEGAQKVTLDANGDLVVQTTDGGTFIQRKPIAFQEVRGTRKDIVVAYALDSTISASFKLGAYDDSKPLTIDPLAYSLLFGQSGVNIGHHVAVDSTGNAYVAGQLASGTQPPNIDAVVEKHLPDGTLAWQSIFHGNGNKDHTDIAFGIAVDGPGSNVFVTGTTTSDDFPTTTTAFSTQCGGTGSCNGKADAFVMQLSATDGTTLYSSYFGGAYDETANAIAVDNAGMVYITGESGQLPVKGPSHAVHSGGNCQFDAYLAKFDTSKSGAASLIFSTLIGGDGNDEGKALAVAPGQITTVGACAKFPCRLVTTGTIYVAGITGNGCTADPNTPFPTTPSAFTIDDGLLQHAFVALLDTSGTRVLYSTVLNTTSALGVAASASSSSRLPFARGFSNAIITGSTGNIASGTAGAFETTFRGGSSDAYVASFDPTKSGLASLVFFTYIGGSDPGTGRAGVDQGNDIAINSSGNITVVGSTNSANFPIPLTIPALAPPQTTLAMGTCNGSPCRDAFVIQISKDGRGDLFSTYLGGKGDDEALGVALCPSGGCSGDIFVTGTTSSVDFPVTTGTFSGTSDGFLTRIHIPTFPIIPQPKSHKTVH